MVKMLLLNHIVEDGLDHFENIILNKNGRYSLHMRKLK